MTEQQTKIQAHFNKLLADKYPMLQPIDKWKQVMWHQDGDLIVSLVLLQKKVKFCFFNSSNLTLNKTQRWGTTITSENLEVENGEAVDWERIDMLLKKMLD